MKIKKEIEPLWIVKKSVRKKGHGRTPSTYCIYYAENPKRNCVHRLRTNEGTELFKILSTTVISKNPKYFYKVYADGVYVNDVLISVINPKKY